MNLMHEAQGKISMAQCIVVLRVDAGNTTPHPRLMPTPTLK